METDELYYSAIDLLKKLIETPSTSREETAAADLIQQYIIGQGQQVCRKNNNIWSIASGYRADRPTLLLNSHIDTVKPVSGWSRPPFTPVEEEGRIYGLGSNDAGASLVSLLHAYLWLSAKEQPYNLLFLASAEEEISGKNGIESVWNELPPVHFAVVGEPTRMQPAIAEKGLMVLDCTVYGQSGHAARQEGDNAIYKALKAVEAFRDFRFPAESDILGPVKLSVTMIQAGTQHNVVPDRCSFVVDVRTNEQYSNAEALAILQKNIDCEITPRSLRLNSSRTEREHPFVQRACLLGLEPFGSPTLSDQALIPVTSVKIGPGDSARSHTADEYIETAEIREGIELYIQLLDHLAIG